MSTKPEYLKKIRRGQQKKKPLSLFLKKYIKNLPANHNTLCKTAEKEMWAEIDCLDCSNCCRTMTPTFSKKEVNVIAKHLNMTYEAYFAKHLKIDEDNGDIVNKIQPCQHLDSKNKCKIYAIRPKDCSGFPHHIRKDFVFQVEQATYQNNIPRCPATLSFVEKLEALVKADGK